MELLERVSGALRAPLTSEDMGILAYAWALKGQRGYSLYWSGWPRQRRRRLPSGRITNPPLPGGRPRRTSAEALAALSGVTEYTDHAGNRQGAVASQLDFLAEQEALEAGRARISRMSFWALVLLVTGIGASLLWLPRARQMAGDGLRSRGAGRTRARTCRWPRTCRRSCRA